MYKKKDSKKGKKYYISQILIKLVESITIVLPEDHMQLENHVNCDLEKGM